MSDNTPIDSAADKPSTARQDITADRKTSTTGPGESAPRAIKPGAMDPRDPSRWPKEYGGQSGPEPTRYGDWEKNGRCTDF